MKWIRRTVKSETHINDCTVYRNKNQINSGLLLLQRKNMKMLDI